MKAKQKNVYFVEVTDLFCGEFNYSWVRRFNVKSVSPLGAARKVAKEMGLNIRKEYECGDEVCYHSHSNLTGMMVESVDSDDERLSDVTKL